MIKALRISAPFFFAMSFARRFAYERALTSQRKRKCREIVDITGHIAASVTFTQFLTELYKQGYKLTYCIAIVRIDMFERVYSIQQTGGTIMMERILPFLIPILFILVMISLLIYITKFIKTL